MTAKKSMTRWSIGRFARWTGGGLAGVLALIFALVFILLLPPVRGKVLVRVVRDVGTVLPGDLTVGDSAWPELGTLEFSNILWTDEGDTLAAAARIGVSARLMPFIQKDIRINRLTAVALRVDVPAIAARFENADTLAAEPDEGGGAGFPRAGSIPGLPSVAVDSIYVAAPSIRLADGFDIKDAVLSAGVDVSFGRPPLVRVDTLAVEAAAGEWRVEELALVADLERGRVDGRGRAVYPPYGPVHLSFSTGDSGRIAVVVAGKDGVSPPEGIGLEISSFVVHDKGRVRSVDFEGVVRTPGARELRDFPELAERIQGLPDLDGLVLEMRGRVDFVPDVSAELETTILSNNWIERGEISALYRPGALDLKRFNLGLPDLDIGMRGWLATDSVGVSADIDCRGGRWLGVLSPGIEAPEPLIAGIAIDASRPPGGDETTAAVRGRGHIAGVEFEQLEVDAELPTVVDRPIAGSVKVRAFDTFIGLGAEISLGETISAALSPIVLLTSPVPPSSISPASAGGGRVEYTATTGRIVADPIRVAGEGGSLAVWTDMALDKGGAVKVKGQWEEPPPLLTRSLGLTEGGLDTLAAAWETDAPFNIEIEAAIDMTNGPAVSATGNLKLPGPRNLIPLLPDSSRVDDLGPVICDIKAETQSDTAGTAFSAEIDLGQTGWMDSTVIVVSGAGGSAVIDTLHIAFEGISLDAEGAIGEDVINIKTVFDIADSRFAGRFLPSLPKFNVSGSAVIGGAPTAPSVKAAIEGAVSSPQVTVPAFEASVDVDSTRIAVDIATPSGVKTQQLELDQVSLSARSVGGRNEPLPVRLSLTASGKDMNLHQSIRVDTVGGVVVDVDTLDLVIGGRDLRADLPFRIRLPGNTERIVVEGLSMSGGLGTVDIGGFIDPDSSSIDAMVSIVLPEKQPPALSAIRPWPDMIDVEVGVEGIHDATLLAQVTGFELIDGRRPELSLELATDAATISANLTVADSTETIIESDVLMPAKVSFYPFGFDYARGEVQVDAELNRVPVVMRLLGNTGDIPEDEAVLIDGTVTIRGPIQAPFGRAAIDADFAGWPKFSQYGLSLDAAFGSRSQRDSLLLAAEIPDAGPSGGRPRGDGSGIDALVRLVRQGAEVLSVEGFHPARISFDPPGFETIEGGVVDYRVNSTDIALDDFDPLLPIDVGLGGILKVNLRVEGPVDNAALDGSMRTQRFEVRVADQARMTAHSNIGVSGTTQRPVIDGEIVIENALIRVPDLPEDLHPVEGESILLEQGIDSLRLVDSTTVRKRPPEADRPRISGDLNIEIKIPAGFWIRGKGLDIELSGNLTVKQKEGVPTVAGELRAVRGSLSVLGRTLRLERGTVTFFGGDEINPSLDIVLETNLDGTEIQIIMGGTVEEPRVNLVSDPEMDESDIVSLLLFGRTFDDLDDGEADLLKNRSRDMIASLGAAKLQEEFGGQVGVDVVSVKSTGRDNEGAALAVGKYLNPRVLLSYAQALDAESDSFVSLEYFLRGRFKLESTFGQRGQTSLGIGWSKDY